MMEQNDLANGMPFSWLPAYGETVESAANRNVLETILEETSDDENNSDRWNNVNNSCSSLTNSDTQSVIEVDLNQDSETLSERDFICPAKRRRQDCEANESIAPRRPTSDGDRYRLDHTVFLDPSEYFAKRADHRFRFDEVTGMVTEMHSDSDSLLFNSLSRSSSLIQFESLERQLLLNDTQYSGATQNAATTANTAVPHDPSLADDVVAVAAKVNLFRKTQNLLPVNGVTSKATALISQPVDAHHNNSSEPISDSDTYSSVESTSSSYSSEESYYLNHSDKNSLEEEDEDEEEEEIEVASSHHHFQHRNRHLLNHHHLHSSGVNGGSNGSVDKRQAFKNKNSVESLSEDSGYCDQSLSALKTKSKSNPNIVGSLDSWHSNSSGFYFDSNRGESSLAFSMTDHYSDTARSMENLTRLNQLQNQNNRSKDSTASAGRKRTTTQLSQQHRHHHRMNLRKTTRIVEEPVIEPSASPSPPLLRSSSLAKNRCGNLENEKKDRSPLERCASITKRVLSNSSPDLLIEHIYQNQLSGGQISRKTLYKLYSKYLHQQTSCGGGNGNSGRESKQASIDQDFCVVSSVPDDLNLCCDDRNRDDSTYTARGSDTYSNFWQAADSRNSYANKDVNLFDLKTEQRSGQATGFGGLSIGGQSVGGGSLLLSPNQPSSAIYNTNYSLTASYANLTLLNYSDENLSSLQMAHFPNGNGMTSTTIPSTKVGAVSGKYQTNDDTNNKKYSSSTSPTSSSSTAFRNEISSLLDEITAHFDRNLSILNDQDEDYDPFYENTIEQKPIRPPPRRSPRLSPVPPPRKSSKNRLMVSTMNDKYEDDNDDEDDGCVDDERRTTSSSEHDSSPTIINQSQHSTTTTAPSVLATHKSHGATNNLPIDSTWESWQPTQKSSSPTTAVVTQPPVPSPGQSNDSSSTWEQFKPSTDKVDKCTVAADDPPPKLPRRRVPPPPPPRRTTFDLDPMCLQTSYAQSLEQCNLMDSESQVNLVEIKSVSKFEPSQHQQLTSQSTRKFISSTPNLSSAFAIYRKPNTDDDDLEHHKSLKDVRAQRTGSILSHGSKSGLSKGVSFCPIVSEISWQETNISGSDTESEEARDAEGDEQEVCFNPAGARHSPNFDDDDEDSDSEGDYVEDRGGFGEYLLPIKTHTFTTSLTMMINDDDDDDDDHTKRTDNSVTAQQVQIPIQAEVHNESKRDSQSVVNKSAPIPPKPPLRSKSNNHEIMNEVVNVDVVAVDVDAQPTTPDSASVKMFAEPKSCEVVTGNRPQYQDPSTSVVCDQRKINKNIINNSTVEGSSAAASSIEKQQSPPPPPVRIVGRRGSGNNINNNKNSTTTSASGGGGNKIAQVMMMNKNNNNTAVAAAAASEFQKSDTINEVNLANNNVIKSKSVNEKFDVQKIKKKDGFFSRLSSRFSFRGKKSGSAELNKKPDAVYNQLEPRALTTAEKKQNRQDQDVIFIPLKGPTNENVESFIKHEIAAVCPNVTTTTTAGSRGQSPDILLHTSNNKQQVVSAKPPLPRQPPRAGTPKRPPAVPQRGGTGGGGGGGNHAHTNQRAASPTRDNNFDNSYYDEIVPANQLRSVVRASDNGSYRSGGAAGAGQTMTSEQKIGLIETNLDTHETVITGKTRSLMELGGPQHYMPHHHHLSVVNNNNVRGRHTLAAGAVKHPINGESNEAGRPHKSMEFLLDKENQRNILPPENELQKSHDNNTNLSEHQLRVQASLQKLNVPDWYKTYSSSSTGKAAPEASGLLRKRNSDVGRWTGLSSKTTSLSSLGSQRSDRSPVMLSPSSHSHHGNSGFSRWSTSHLNSNQTSPSVSTRGSFTRGVLTTGYPQSSNNTLRGSYRQPYLGWRSQEKLSQPRTPAERLASSLLQQKQVADRPPKPPRTDLQQQQAAFGAQQQSAIATTSSLQQPAVTPEIQSSIKEVTSAIVHYVNDQTSRHTPRSRSVSPSQRCWLESSFVGTKPLESPQTPIIDNNSFVTATSAVSTPQQLGQMQFNTTTNPTVRLDNSRLNGSVPTFSLPAERPTSATLDDTIDLDDVLANLLGLPTKSRRPVQDTTVSQMTEIQANKANQLCVEQQTERRKSEGDTVKRRTHVSEGGGHQRKLSLDSFETKSVELVRCRYPKCDSTATPQDAKKTFKSCHNCSHSYCSRECRRNHWEKHRKACLHSRVSALCRQVLSACKDDADTLRHLSLLARRGFLSQGRGVIRILFRSPESADVFIKQGFQCLGEVTYVRWPDLMPAEMGPELYSELLRLSTEYKPESKMLLYVAICVVSEAPSTAQAPVKWERQLVSRCAKLKLCKSIINDVALQPLLPISSTMENDVLILTFNLTRKNTQKLRENVLSNIQIALRQKGVNLRRHFPEVFQRFSSYVEGTTDRFLPVTMHPRDSVTGRAFVCIIMPSNDENDIKIPSSDNGAKVQIVDMMEPAVSSYRGTSLQHQQRE